MSRRARQSPSIQTGCSNPLPSRRSESPDLLTRCLGGTVVDFGIGGSGIRNNTDSPADHTDIIISDDDTPSFDSDATLIIDPDIIIDHEEKHASNTSNAHKVIECRTLKEKQPLQENVGMIRCKPLEDLLSENNRSSPRMHVNDGSENGDHCKKLDMVYQEPTGIPENCLNSPKRCNTWSSDSSSSSPIPPTPTPKRSRPRRRKVISSNSEDSDTLVDCMKSKSDRKTGQRIFQINTQPRSSRKLCTYRPLLKEWSMHEATPPTSSSDESHDESEKLHSRDHRASSPAKSSGRNKCTPKYISNKNYRIKKIIDAKTDKVLEKKYNTRSTKVNIGNNILQSSNIQETIVHPNVSNVVFVRDKLVQDKLDEVVIEYEKYATVSIKKPSIDHPNVGNVVSVSNKLILHKFKKVSPSDGKEVRVLNKPQKIDDPCAIDVINVNDETIRGRQVPVSDKTQESDPYKRWMQRYPNIEAQIRKDRDVPTGTTFCAWERVGMIWWLLKTGNIPVARLKNTWAQMQADGYLKHRSMRSLQNHFLRKILPNLQEFSLPAEIVKEFEIIMR